MLAFPFPTVTLSFLTIYVKSVNRELANNMAAVRIRRKKRMNSESLQKTVTYSR